MKTIYVNYNLCVWEREGNIRERQEEGVPIETPLIDLKLPFWLLSKSPSMVVT